MFATPDGGHEIGYRVSVQAAMRVNAEQSSTKERRCGGRPESGIWEG